MQKNGPVVAWIVDDTGFPKQGKHSVGVARQYCGQIGKHDNCQAAVSLSVATWNTSLPIAWRLYLPEMWCQDSERRQKAGIPEGIEFQTKPAIALEQADSFLPDIGSIRLRSVSRQRSTCEERSGPQVGCVRLPMATVSAFGGITAGILQTRAGGLCGPVDSTPSRGPGTDGKHSRTAHAESA
jgi:hypothetical protein